MKIDDFKLERYFAKYEFQTKYLLSSSDCDGYSLKYILDKASPEELKIWENQKFGYTESTGNPFLRESISQFYTKISPENIVVSSPGEANFILMNTLLEKTDHVICMSPAYQSLYQVVKSIDCELSYWEPDETTWKFDPNSLEKLIRPNTKLIIINFPHNPTGAFPALDELNKIVEIAKKNDIWLFSDEMYRKLTINNTPDIPPVCDLYEKGVSLWGMAKTFGLAGLRIGWVASQDTALLEKIVSYKDYLTICNSAPSEILSAIALNHSNDFIKPNLEKIEKNISLFSKFILDFNSIFNFIMPKAGSTGFVKLHIKEPAFEFSEKLVKDTGIMTIPSELFEYGDKHIRIGFGRENFPEIIEILSSYISANYR
ncbi:MAG: aminotransferase class I/II-fold pyridoxal phosphate-dependent enzyme [Rhodothermaceae bacterium]